MTRSNFEKYAKNGRTVISMDFVEGKEELCTTGVSGNPNLVLDQLARKLAYVFLQLQSVTKCDVVKNIDILANNVKVYYAKLVAANAQKGKKRGKSK